MAYSYGERLSGYLATVLILANALKETVSLSFSGFLVVTRITPLAPREPYTAVAEASFNTSMEAISAGFNDWREPPMNPSITTSGPVSAVIELIPRTRMVLSPLGSPEPESTDTPAIRPCKASDTLPVGVLFNASAVFTEATAPVKSLLR